VRTWWPYLDLARGVAALLVALSHLRGFVFVDFHAVDHPGLVWSGFYFVTGFGHQAVMVFFVMSGFLVGGTVVSRAETGQWSWIDYAITRMTRLWIVLLPALLLTALWDNLGIAITGSSFYNGGMAVIYTSTHFHRNVIRAGSEFESRMRHLFASLPARIGDSGY